MRKQGIMLHDILALAENLIGDLLAARNESCTVRQKNDTITRDEFDAALAMIARFRNAQEELQERLSALEAKLNLSSRKQRKTGTKLFLRNVKHGNQSKRRA